MKLILSDSDQEKEGFTSARIQPGRTPETTMPHRDNTVDEMEVDHGAEFYGSVAGLFAVSEWFRILKPGGRLKMTCVDMEALFEKFLQAKDDAGRHRLIHQIYHSERSGRHYICCFPRPLLEKLLRKNGFIFIEFQAEAAGLKVSCKKPIKTGIRQTMANFRKKAVMDGWIDPYDHLTALSMEEALLDPLAANWQNYLKEKKETYLAQILILGALYHPALTGEFFKLGETGKEINPDLFTACTRTLSQLARRGFPSLLIYTLKNDRKDAEKWHVAYQRIKHLAEDCIRQIFSHRGKNGEEIIRRFFPLGEDPQYKPDARARFSKNHIMDTAKDFCYLGIKALGQGRYDRAESLFQEALTYYWELPLAEWNLAVTAAVKAQWPDAISGYLRLTRIASPEILPALEKELAACYFFSDNRDKATPLFKKNGIDIKTGFSPELRNYPVLAEESYNWSTAGFETEKSCHRISKSPNREAGICRKREKLISR